MKPFVSVASHFLPSGSTPRRGLFLLMGSVLLAICAVFAVLMNDARSDARRAAEAAALNLATALSRDMDRNVELLDLSIQAARDTWSDPRVRSADPSLRQLMLFDHSATASYIDTILVVDRDGAVLADSRSVVPRVRDFRTADFFRAQAERDVGLFIGKPMQVSGKPGWHMALSRRIIAADGGFAGVAVGFLNLDYVSETFRRLPQGTGGVLLLFNTDGTLLVREPASSEAIGRSFRGGTTFDCMATGGSGSFAGTSLLDGRSRLYSFHRVGDLPLIQVVGTSTEAVYARWRSKAQGLTAVLALLCMGTLSLLIMLKRELSQRVAAETALEALASRDHLTGLLSRRKFFALAEDRRAEADRDGLGLSILMIDADHFKGYNDRYGHVAGDDVLSEVGRCISDELRLPADLAARYGGEEFIVLMSGLDLEAAFVVAEAIRASVTRLARPHDRAPAGVVTISIGVASAEPGSSLDLRALVEEADAELYRSKRDGRNRSSAGGPVVRRLQTSPETRSA